WLRDGLYLNPNIGKLGCLRERLNISVSLSKCRNRLLQPKVFANQFWIFSQSRVISANEPNGSVPVPEIDEAHRNLRRQVMGTNKRAYRRPADFLNECL